MSRTEVNIDTYGSERAAKVISYVMGEMEICLKQLSKYCNHEFHTPMRGTNGCVPKHDDSMALVTAKWQEFRTHQDRLERELKSLSNALKGIDEAAKKEIENAVLKHCT